MKNNTRVLIGGALVLGLAAGGGTFALWTQTAEISGGGVNTGELSITPTTDGAVYTDLTPGAANTGWPEGSKMVPGDVVTASQGYKLTLVGKNLHAGLTLGDLTPTFPGATQAQAEALAAHVSVVPTITITRPGGTAEAYTAGTELTAADNNAVVNVVLTYTFDPETPGQVAQNGAVEVEGPAATLTQQLATP